MKTLGKANVIPICPNILMMKMSFKAVFPQRLHFDNVKKICFLIDLVVFNNLREIIQCVNQYNTLNIRINS